MSDDAENNPTAQGMAAVKAAIHSDPGYAWGWQCNLACAAQDEGMERAAANRAAGRFLFTTFEYKIEDHPHYAETQKDEVAVEAES